MRVLDHKQVVQQVLATGGQGARFDALLEMRDPWTEHGTYLLVAPLDATEKLPFGGSRYLDWSVGRE